MKLRKGDKVKISSGKDKGKEGVIDRVYPKQEKILIQGINMIKRHIKKNQELPQGGIVDIPKPMQSSAVMLICPQCSKPTRIGFSVEKGKKVRICHKCHKPLK